MSTATASPVAPLVQIKAAIPGCCGYYEKLVTHNFRADELHNLRPIDPSVIADRFKTFKSWNGPTVDCELHTFGFAWRFWIVIKEHATESATPAPTALEVEIAFRLRHGWTQLSVKEFTARFAELGYRLDRSHDCRCTAKYLDDGRTYPACSVFLVNIATGRSAWNEDKSGADFIGLQKLRGEIFAVSRGAILEV